MSELLPPKTTVARGVFLDKDGTLIDNVPFNVDPEQIRLAQGAVEGVTALHRAGYLILVVSNQSGVARGLFPEKALAQVKHRLQELLAEFDVPLAGFYYCPHHPEGSVSAYAAICLCRKPAPGLLFQAADELNINCRQSWLIGDTLDDIEAGCRAGCRTVMIDNGNETEWKDGPARIPHHKAADLAEAAQIILANQQLPGQPKQRGLTL